MLFEVLLDGQLIWNLPLLVGLVCVVIIYYVLLTRTTQLNLLHLKPLLFVVGVGLLYLLIGSPLKPISHLSFSFHMIQMSLLYFMIPPLILLGIPESMFQRVVDRPQLKRICRFRLSPQMALYAFALLFLMYHIPAVLSLLSEHSFSQNGYLFLLFVLAFGMWWPIVSPDKTQRLSKERMKRYAFLSGWLIMPACLFFIVTAFLDGLSNPFLAELSAHICMPASSSFSLLPPPFNTKYDQVMAGVSMLGLHKVGLMMTLKLTTKF